MAAEEADNKISSFAPKMVHQVATSRSLKVRSELLVRFMRVVRVGGSLSSDELAMGAGGVWWSRVMDSACPPSELSRSGKRTLTKQMHKLDP